MAQRLLAHQKWARENDPPQPIRSRGREGLADLSGFIELDDKTPEEFASLILGRLAIHEGNPKDHYTKPAPPPVVVLKTDIPPALLRPRGGAEEDRRRPLARRR
jgi:hypothetical protein